MGVIISSFSSMGYRYNFKIAVDQRVSVADFAGPILLNY